LEQLVSDIGQNTGLFTLIVTGMILLIVESARGTRPVVSYYVSIFGLLLSLSFFIMDFSLESQSFYGMIQTGAFANFFNILFVIACLLSVVYSRYYLQKLNYHRGELYVLLILSTVGMSLIASASDLIILFLGIELMSLALYVLVGFVRNLEKKNEASLKYFLLGAFATGFLVYGIALIYGATGTTNINSLSSVYKAGTTSLLFLSGILLLFSALAFKSAAVPFHMWAPDVYEGAPTPITGFMSTAAKAAAVSAFITIFIRTFSFAGTKTSEIIAIVSVASMILGNVVAIAQNNIKRMLAYSSIAHAGYMLVGISAGSVEGKIGVMFYIAVYAIMNLGAFAVVGLLERENENNLLIEDYSGLGKTKPFLAALMAIFMFALTGLPPFAGFFGKYYVFVSAIKANMTWLAIVGVLASLVSAYYYLRVVVIMYFRDAQSEIQKDTLFMPKIVLLSIFICALAVLILGIFPSLIVNIALQSN